jgi:hypothetical protein
LLTLPLSLAWNALVIGWAFSLLNGLAGALFFEWLIVIPVAFVTDFLFMFNIYVDSHTKLQ